MKKFILVLICFLYPALCYAVHLYEPYMAYPNNPNLIFITDSYKGDWSNIHIGCFLYKNTEGAILNGQEFEYEYLCIGWNTQTDAFTTYTENKSRFIYYNNVWTYGEPYYFQRPNIQVDVKDMFVDLSEGTWSDRD